MKLINKQFVFVGTETVPACHASTVLKLKNGSLLFAWFAGTREGAIDVGIWHALLEDGRLRPAERVPDALDIPHRNPVLFQKKDGTVCLFYKVGPNCSDWWTMITTSKDGKIWDTPRELIAGDRSGGRGPVKNKPIYTRNGTLLAPASTEKGPWRPFIDKFDGENWHKIHIPSDDSINLIQPSLWESEDGHISALMRSNQGVIYRSDSEDGGDSWCHVYPTQIPNSNSGLDCVGLGNGRVVLVCNPVQKGRTPLSVFLSRDNGATFTEELVLESEPGEFSYPAVISDGNQLYITYSWRRKNIAFCQIEID